VTSVSSTPSQVPVADRSGAISCTFPSLPLRPRQYVVRLTIFDTHRAVEYDQITAGPRFLVTASEGDHGDSDEDGFVTIPATFDCSVSA
jgi:hypothetical protein